MTYVTQGWATENRANAMVNFRATHEDSSRPDCPSLEECLRRIAARLCRLDACGCEVRTASYAWGECDHFVVVVVGTLVRWRGISAR